MLRQFFLGVATTLTLGGCATLSYYAQAVGGHMQVMGLARPIPDLLVDPATEPGLRSRLENVAAIREFASRELALPDNGSYRSYADLGRPYVVWNVFAAEEFSVDLESWCFPLVGCVNYRGYYDREAAEKFARELEKQELETHVGNVPAYSTLGVFDDPVLNTFLGFGEPELARLIFHELAHQRLFLPGDSTFNESFATTVENEGMRRWLAATASPEAFASYQARQERKVRIQELLASYRSRLKDLYTLPLPADRMRQAKAGIFAQLRREHDAMTAQWGGRSGYEAFFGQGLNNARLGSAGLYNKLVPAFEALLAETGHDLPSFYRQAAALAKLSKTERRLVLEKLLGQGDPETGEPRAHGNRQPG